MLCSEAILYGIPGSQKETALCLGDNGIGTITSLRDATDPRAQGALLNDCREDPTYRQSPAA